MSKTVDPDFLALPLAALSDAAISAGKAAGASHVDVRIERTRSGLLALRDTDLQSQSDETVFGIGVRVIVNGAWGFASSPDVSIATAKKMAEIAVSMAKTSKPLSTEEVTLTPEPVYANQQWVSAYEIDPFAVTDLEKISRLTDLSATLLKSSNVNHTSAHSMYVKEQKHYADSYGTSTTQQRVRVQTQIEAISVGAHGFESMRTLSQPAGYGWEWMGNSIWNWDQEIAQLPALLAEKVAAPSVTPGKYDLLIHPSNLWLTIHESIGHATELDRAIGYEANYAGTSFATPDKLNNLQYGSHLMNVTGDRETEHGLSTVGWDDEGVAAQRWDIVKDGVLVGYQLDRRIAAGSARSVVGFNLYEAIHACREHLIGYGGHFAAAGMTLLPDNVTAFAAAFEAAVSAQITDDLLIPEIVIDTPISFKEINQGFYNILSQMEPFGPENMKPVFIARGVNNTAYSKIVKEQHIRFVLQQDGITLTGIGFKMADKFALLQMNQPLDIVFTLDENEWNNEKTIQLKMIDLRLSA